MWLLDTFCCCIDLFNGCIIIAISGLIISLLGFAVAYQAAVRSDVAVSVCTFLFFILYLAAKIILLLGTIWEMSLMIFVAFILSAVFTIIALIGLLVWIALGITALEAIVIFLAILLEAYFCWVIYSYWRARKICDECPQCT